MAKVRAVSVADRDQETWEHGQLIARRRGISMSQLIIQAIRKEIDKWEPVERERVDEPQEVV